MQIFLNIHIIQNKDPKTSVLGSLAGIAGLEPADAGVKVLCLTGLAISQRLTDIERLYHIYLDLSIPMSHYFVYEKTDSGPLRTAVRLCVIIMLSL